MQAVILAGGLATRLRPVTETIPKLLVEVAGKPFADHQLAWLRGCGVDEVILCVGHLGEQIRAHVGEGAVYVDEGEHLRGTGGALRLAYDEGVLAPEFVVVYGDSYLPLDVGAVMDDFRARRPDALMTVLRNADALEPSNARFADGRVVVYDKTRATPGLDYIDYGLSILDRDAVAPLLPAEGDLATVYADLATAGRLAGYEVHERFYEVGSHAGLAELDRLLSDD